MQQQRPIFLLTDFGVTDPYVGIMKSVMMRLGCDGQMVDLTHGIRPQDVLAGAIAIEDAWPWLPSDGILVAVVDPGVGTTRRALVVNLDERIAVGPDNGLFEPLLALGGRARLIEAGGAIQPARSATFHGRDVFAPAAALLATGRREFFQMGPEIPEPKRLAIPPPGLAGDGSELSLRVLTVDHFGNAVLNLRLDQAFANRVEGLTFWHLNQPLGPLRRTFGDVARGEPLVYWSSAGRLEVAVNGGDASNQLGLHAGSVVTGRPMA
jgi:S-adenosylmethionine hydrolase